MLVGSNEPKEALVYPWTISGTLGIEGLTKRFERRNINDKDNCTIGQDYITVHGPLAYCISEGPQIKRPS